RVEGMSFIPEHTDDVTLSPLPPAQWVISPLSPHPEALSRERAVVDMEREIAARQGLAATAF
ncbi:unnamed protein product, partial [marine sediment metagenome]